MKEGTPDAKAAGRPQRTADEIRAAVLQGAKAAGPRPIHVSGADIVAALTGQQPDDDKPE